MPVKPLSFKGDKKPHKKRKKEQDLEDQDSKALTTTSNNHNGAQVDEDDDSWVSCDLPSDLTGPTLLVLPTSPPTALASDAHGNIFASSLENIVEDDPASAEPHDVRQVWIATRIAGTAEGQVSFKGSHSKYLSCDSHGILSSKREAIGREETFQVVIAAESVTGEGSVGGQFALKTAATGGEGKEMFIRATGGEAAHDGDVKRKKPIEVRGDGDGISYSTTLRIRMQARFKPRLKMNKEAKAKEKISRQELERAVGRKLEDDEVKKLKKARRDGTYHEEILDVRVKGKHDKFAS